MSTGSLTFLSLLRQRYRILKPVGLGGFGAVYQAEDTVLGNRIIAVKEMSQSNLTPQEQIEATESFKHEALLLASLSHPHLPHVYDYFTENGRWYLVMDFIEGGTLDQTISSQRRTFSLQETLHLAIQLCDVLHYLHTRRPPIIFRDLKPGNIILTATGKPMLIDFGIARHFKPGQATDTIPLGSPGYAAPEQYGRTQSTPGSDIYSLGALLHTLISGDDPANHPFRFAPLPSSVPQKLAALIIEMLDINIAHRPSSVAIVRQRLEHILAEVQALPQKPAPVVVLPQQSVAASTVATPQAKPAALPQPTAVRSSPDTAICLLQWSSDASRIAAIRFNGTIDIVETRTGTLLYSYKKHVPTGVSMAYALAWSADGQYIASGGSDCTVRIWDISSGQTIRNYDGHAGYIRSISWSPNGQLVASLDSRGSICIWEAATGRTIMTKEDVGQRISLLSWSPDSRLLASQNDNIRTFWGGNKTVISIWNVASGEETARHSGHSEELASLAWSPDGNLIASSSIYTPEVQVWSALTGKTLTAYQDHAAHGIRVCWSPYKSMLASVDCKGEVHLWDYRKDYPLAIYRAFTNKTKSIWPMAWSPTCQQLAFAEDERDIHFWDIPRLAWKQR